MAKMRFPVLIFGFCLMPNHFHLVLQPKTADALSPFKVGLQHPTTSYPSSCSCRSCTPNATRKPLAYPPGMRLFS